MTMKVALIGATGFVESVILKEALARGAITWEQEK